jgi:PPOX class probable F420-dependent enzyme
MTPGEAQARFAAARVARLATITAGGAARLVPITFAVLAGSDQSELTISAPSHHDLDRGFGPLPVVAAAGRRPIQGESGDHANESTGVAATIRDPAEQGGPARPLAGLGTVVTAVDHKPKSTTRLRRLDDIVREPRVTLLADEYDDDWSHLWWARAEGLAQVVEPGSPDHAAAVRALAARYPQYREQPPAGPAIVIGVTRWSGWSYVR